MSDQSFPTNQNSTGQNKQPASQHQAVPNKNLDADKAKSKSGDKPQAGNNVPPRA